MAAVHFKLGDILVCQFFPEMYPDWIDQIHDYVWSEDDGTFSTRSAAE